MLLPILALACRSQSPSDSSADQQESEPLKVRGQISSGTVPKVWISGEEVVVTEIVPEVMTQANGVCPNDDIFYVLDNGQEVYDTKTWASLYNIPNSSSRITECMDYPIGASFPLPAGYYSKIPTTGQAETLNFTDIKDLIVDLVGDEEMSPFLHSVVALNNGCWLIPFGDTFNGHYGAVVYDSENNRAELVYEETVSLDTPTDYVSVSVDKATDDLGVMNVYQSFETGNTYELQKSIFFNLQDGEISDEISFDEYPLYAEGTESLEGVPLDQLADYVQTRMSGRVYDQDNVYFISTPEIARESGLSQQTTQSTLVRIDRKTGARAEIPLDLYGSEHFIFDEVSGKYLVWGYKNPRLAPSIPDGSTNDAYYDFKLLYLDLDSGDLTDEQTLLENVELDRVGLASRTLEESEVVWDNGFVVQYSVFNTSTYSSEFYHDYYYYHPDTGLYQYDHTENSQREIEVQNFSYQTDKGDAIEVTPSEHYLTFQSDEMVYTGYNRDFLYVNPATQQALYFRNLLSEEDSCVVFELGGSLYSSCEREQGSVTLKGDDLLVGIGENVVSIQIHQ